MLMELHLLVMNIMEKRLFRMEPYMMEISKMDKDMERGQYISEMVPRILGISMKVNFMDTEYFIFLIKINMKDNGY